MANNTRTFRTDTNIIPQSEENVTPDNKLYQAAYHGTPHNFESFSLENIGTGEGAQAHGWGLYFAGDKDVSEGYRKKLTAGVGGFYHDLYVLKDEGKQYIVKKDGEQLRTDIDEDGYTYAVLKAKQLGKEKAVKLLEEDGYPDYIIDEEVNKTINTFA